MRDGKAVEFNNSQLIMDVLLRGPTTRRRPERPQDADSVSSPGVWEDAGDVVERQVRQPPDESRTAVLVPREGES